MQTSTIIPEGTKLLQAYEIVSRLGGGGMADVYKVRHSALGEQRAIKLIRADLSTDQRVQELFLREAHALKRIQHPAIVRCYEFLPDEQRGVWCMIMELVEGTPLSVMCAQRPLNPLETIDLLKTLASGLDASHRAGVVHRDLSPDNVILPDEKPKNAKIIDFGIARIDEFSQQTIIGSDFTGKYGYASPEQFGMFDGRIDGRSDIYSLGLVIAAASLGRKIDMGKSFYEAINKRKRIPAAVPALHVKIRPTVERMLAPDPRHRFQSMREVVDFIENKGVSRTSYTEEETDYPDDLFPEWMLPEPATHSASLENLYTGRSEGHGRRFMYGAFLVLLVLGIVGGFFSDGIITDWVIAKVNINETKSQSNVIHKSLTSKDKFKISTGSAIDHQPVPPVADESPKENALKRTLKGIIKEPPRSQVKKPKAAAQSDGSEILARNNLEKPPARKKQETASKNTDPSSKEKHSSGWNMRQFFRDVVDWLSR